MKTFTLAAEVPWAPATIIVADTCCECHAAEPVLVWNRAYPVCQACADAWTRKREQARAPKKD